jgi:hypothetical protein
MPNKLYLLKTGLRTNIFGIFARFILASNISNKANIATYIDSNLFLFICANTLKVIYKFCCYLKSRGLELNSYIYSNIYIDN